MPAVRYCSTPAGRVAYSAVGSGPPLLCDTGWISHLRAQLGLFAFGSFIDRLAERFTVIRYDKPGCGLSDRKEVDLSFDAQVTAALAVADAAHAERFAMFGASQGGQVAAGPGGEHRGEPLVELVLVEPPAGEVLAELGRRGFPLGVADPHLVFRSHGVLR